MVSRSSGQYNVIVNILPNNHFVKLSCSIIINLSNGQVKTNQSIPPIRTIHILLNMDMHASG